MSKRSSSDSVTTLWAAPGHWATKKFRKTQGGAIETIGYNAGRVFMIETFEVCDIEDLSNLLRLIEPYPEVLVIRGAVVNSEGAKERVARTGSGLGDAHVGNFRTPERGRYYVMIDVDHITLPLGLQLVQVQIAAIAEYLVQQLPGEFRDATYHWQLSASAGLKSKNEVSMHLWFWLKSPVPDAALKRWAGKVNESYGRKLVDPALFQHVQAHYTAAPLFEGLDDPFPTRSGLVRKAKDRVKLNVPQISAPDSEPVCVRRVSSSLVEARGFEYLMAQIGDHKGGDGFHAPIVKAVASYISTHGADGTDVEALYNIVRNRVESADASRHPPGYAAEVASRAHIVSAIESALRKYGTSRATRAKLHEGMAPHFEAEVISLEEAKSRLEAHIAKLF